MAVEGVNDVQVNQTDAAGNVSDNTSFSFVLDTRAPAPLTILATVDSGVSDQDMISNDPSMVISTPEALAKQIAIDFARQRKIIADNGIKLEE